MATINFKKGNSLNLPLSVQIDGAPRPIAASDSLVYLLKSRPSDPDSLAVIRFTETETEGVRIAREDADNGDLRLIAPAIKTRLSGLKYFGALQITTAAGDVIECPTDSGPDEWVPIQDLVSATS